MTIIAIVADIVDGKSYFINMSHKSTWRKIFKDFLGLDFMEITT